MPCEFMTPPVLAYILLEIYRLVALGRLLQLCICFLLCTKSSSSTRLNQMSGQTVCSNACSKSNPRHLHKDYPERKCVFLSGTAHFTSKHKNTRTPPSCSGPIGEFSTRGRIFPPNAQNGFWLFPSF